MGDALIAAPGLQPHLPSDYNIPSLLISIFTLAGSHKVL